MYIDQIPNQTNVCIANSECLFEEEEEYLQQSIRIVQI